MQHAAWLGHNHASTGYAEIVKIHVTNRVAWMHWCVIKSVSLHAAWILRNLARAGYAQNRHSQMQHGCIHLAGAGDTRNQDERMQHVIERVQVTRRINVNKCSIYGP